MPLPAAFVSPRTLVVSWRPSIPFVKEWVEALCDQLDACEGLSVIDVLAKGTQAWPPALPQDGRAGLREDTGHELLTVFNVAYVKACDGGDNELLRLARNEAPFYTRRWVARLEKFPPWDARLKASGCKPWAERERWRVLPASDRHFSQYNDKSEAKTPQQILDEIYEGAVTPMLEPADVSSSSAAPAPDSGHPTP